MRPCWPLLLINLTYFYFLSLVFNISLLHFSGLAFFWPALYPGHLLLTSQTHTFLFCSFAEALLPPGSRSRLTAPDFLTRVCYLPDCLGPSSSGACSTSGPSPSSSSCLCSPNYSSLTWLCKAEFPEAGKPLYLPHPIIHPCDPLIAVKHWKCWFVGQDWGIFVLPLASASLSVPSPFPAPHLLFISYWETMVPCKEICVIFYFDSSNLTEKS